MGSIRIKGTKLGLKLGSDAAAKDFWADITSYKLAPADRADKGSLTTFEDASAGDGKGYKLTFTAAQSTSKTSLWHFAWDNVGEQVAATLAPHGNATPSVEQPHFIFTVEIGQRPDLGGDAGSANEFSFDAEWEVVGSVVLDDGTVTP